MPVYAWVNIDLDVDDFSSTFQTWPGMKKSILLILSSTFRKWNETSSHTYFKLIRRQRSKPCNLYTKCERKQNIEMGITPPFINHDKHMVTKGWNTLTPNTDYKGKTRRSRNGTTGFFLFFIPRQSSFLQKNLALLNPFFLTHCKIPSPKRSTT